MAHTGSTVSFDGRGLRLDTAEDAEVICNEIVGKNVEVLILQGNTFGVEAAEQVGRVLSTLGNLQEAHFKDLFTSRGREEVPLALSHLLRGIADSGAQLTLLDLSDNAIGPIGAPSVIEFLESSSAETLEKLYLHNCGLGPEGSSSIAVTIPNLKSLREFICGRNRLEDKGATNMSRALSELSKIEVLKLNQNGINVKGIQQLVNVLKVNKETIRELDLSDNTIKAEGADALGNFISRAACLRVMRLDDALLENGGFSNICDALSKCPSLPYMDKATFDANELHGNKVVDLVDLTFSVCKPTFELHLLDNEFSKSELIRLQSFSDQFSIQVDNLESDEDEDEEDNDYDEEDEEKAVNHRANGGIRYVREEGEIDNSSEDSHGYVDLGNIESDLREVAQDFVQATDSQPYDAELVNSTFNQMISTAARPSEPNRHYYAVQILCEELGLIKSEETKKKVLARNAVVYIGKRLNDLPKAFRDCFEVVVKNNDDMSCGKVLFEKLDI